MHFIEKDVHKQTFQASPIKFISIDDSRHPPECGGAAGTKGTATAAAGSILFVTQDTSGRTT